MLREGADAQVLAHNAVHAAFAGYTGVTVGLVNTHYVYLPIPVVIQAPRKVCVATSHCHLLQLAS
jgi:6-phosphofructokinase